MGATASPKPRAKDWSARFLPFILAMSIALLVPRHNCASDNQPDMKIRIHWIDVGDNLQEDVECFDWRQGRPLGPLPETLKQILRTPSAAGEIFVPCPVAEYAPRTESEWRMLTEYYLKGIRAGIEESLGRGINDFVIGTTMNNGSRAQASDKQTAYSGPGRNDFKAKTSSKLRSHQYQARFAGTFLNALSTVRQELAGKQFEVACRGLVSGDASRIATRSLTRVARNPLDSLMALDSRVALGDTLRAATALKGRLVLVSTQPDPQKVRIASTAPVEKLLKMLRPGITMVRVDIPAGQLISSLGSPGQGLVVEPHELILQGTVPAYQPMERIGARKLLENLEGSLTSGRTRSDESRPRHFHFVRSAVNLAHQTVRDLRATLEVPLNPYDFVGLTDDFLAKLDLLQRDSEAEEAKEIGAMIGELFGEIALALVESIMEATELSEPPDECELLAGALENACVGAGQAGARAAEAFSYLWPDSLSESAAEGFAEANERNCEAMSEIFRNWCRMRIPIPLTIEVESDDNDQDPPRKRMIEVPVGLTGSLKIMTQRCRDGFPPPCEFRCPDGSVPPCKDDGGGATVSIRIAETRMKQLAKLFDGRRIVEAILQERWLEATELLTAYTSISDDPVARLLLAHVFLATNKNNEALAQVIAFSGERDVRAWLALTDEVVRQYPENHVAFLLRGDALARSGQWELAITTLTKAMELNSNSALAGVMRGKVYAAMGKLDDALVDFDAATQADPKLVEAWTGVAETLAGLGKPVGAFRSLDRALALNPDHALARVLESNLKNALGDSEGSLEAAKRAEKMIPESARNLILHLARRPEKQQDSKKIQDEWKNYPPHGISTRELVRTPLDRGDQPITVKFGLWYGGNGEKAND